ncbi:flagellar basal body P-ring protein FlgI [Pseudoxanthomonas sp.]|uniref:flagellar basal body P-ring protein FlgI n=1 Tax=Pseudoxanthomonas sp. TaxID=1871049 RepID=UPI002633994C|nr:flagellar basal body P-ring protein FlgI [Pseudoxanthomonas sp.]WDS36848.1 MAG: flagellar basal body P-ring protein FlgI [Pseudoxanthomonas sp.]
MAARWWPLPFLVLALALLPGPALAERIKDIADIGGVRGNPLIGYGLVVGLDGTGDRTSQTPFTVQSLRNMLNELGVNLPSGVNPQLKNVAAVAIHAELPPFAKPGQPIDITVSSIGNSVSLRGGSLLMAPLKGIDGQIYAIAQGSLVVGGFGAEGKDGSRISVNVPSVGRIPNGATVERALPDIFGGSNVLTINLHQPDFTTASRMVAVLNETFGPDSAAAIDGGTISMQAPSGAGQRVNFLAQVENLELTPGESAARIVVNSRTGTVVIGSAVRVMPAAVSHGSLTVTVSESTVVSQPDAFSAGNTVATPQSQVSATAQGGHMFKFQGGVSLEQIVKAVNDIGAAPGDLIAILEALKQVGALQADLEVI